jgi:hypothetical protein
MGSVVGKGDEFIALLETVDFFLKQIKVSLYFELRSTHFFNRSLVFKRQRVFHYFPENQRFKNKMTGFFLPLHKDKKQK